MRSADLQTAWIGVDQQLVALDLNKGSVAIALPLSSNLVQIITAISITVVLTELEVIIFNKDRSIRSIKGLPDVGMNLLLQGNTLTIQLLDGNILMLNSETGALKEPMLAA